MIKSITTVPPCFVCIAEYKDYIGGLAKHKRHVRGTTGKIIIASDGIDKKILEEKQITPDIVYKKETWDTGWGSGAPPIEMESYYNCKDGGYVGDKDTGEYFLKKGINPMLSTPDHTVCSIGFCEKENKWYGWSHRAICGYGIGDKLFDESYGNDHTPYAQHGTQTIETLEQAKQAAQAFAESVS